MSKKNPLIGKTPEQIMEYFRTQGAKGGRIGGVKASANMTPEQRTARALKAVAARKAHPMLTDEEKARRLAAKRPVGRPKKVIDVLETKEPKPRGRPRKEADNA